MRYLESMDGAVEYVTQVSRRGLQVFSWDHSTTNKVANRAREDNPKEVFGDVFEEFEFLETGQGKYYVLKNLIWKQFG